MPFEVLVGNQQKTFVGFLGQVGGVQWEKQDVEGPLGYKGEAHWVVVPIECLYSPTTPLLPLVLHHVSQVRPTMQSIRLQACWR